MASLVSNLLSALAALCYGENAPAGQAAAIALGTGGSGALHPHPPTLFDTTISMLLAASKLQHASQIAQACAYLPWGTSPLSAAKSGRHDPPSEPYATRVSHQRTGPVAVER